MFSQSTGVPNDFQRRNLETMHGLPSNLGCTFVRVRKQSFIP